MLIFMNESALEEHLFQLLKTINKQFKRAVTFPTAYNGIFKVPDKNKKLCFSKSITDKDSFIQIQIPNGTYELENLNKKTKRNVLEEGHYTEVDYPFTIIPSFSTLGPIIEISTRGPLTTFRPNDSMGDLLRFDMTTIYEEDNLSPNSVDIVSFDNLFLECNIAQGMIFKSKRSGIIYNFTMDVNLGYKYIEKLRGDVQWYMRKSKDFISSIRF